MIFVFYAISISIVLAEKISEPLGVITMGEKTYSWEDKYDPITFYHGVFDDKYEVIEKCGSSDYFDENEFSCNSIFIFTNLENGLSTKINVDGTLHKPSFCKNIDAIKNGRCYFYKDNINNISDRYQIKFPCRDTEFPSEIFCQIKGNFYSQTESPLIFLDIDSDGQNEILFPQIREGTRGSTRFIVYDPVDIDFSAITGYRVPAIVLSSPGMGYYLDSKIMVFYGGNSACTGVADVFLYEQYKYVGLGFQDYDCEDDYYKWRSELIKSFSNIIDYKKQISNQQIPGLFLKTQTLEKLSKQELSALSDENICEWAVFGGDIELEKFAQEALARGLNNCILDLRW